MAEKVIIMGAAGRDFHNFNVYFRNNKKYKVICFTATQIPGIEKRKYSSILAGKLYKKGIPIYSEQKLTELIKKHKIDHVFLSYSDLSYDYVMHKASQVLAAGANFGLLGKIYLKSKKPIISVCAVRTGSGKSKIALKLAKTIKQKGKTPAVIRHPMPYGDLAKQTVQRFKTYNDLKKHNCTIEEREEYEQYINAGITIYAGVDYEKILKKAEKQADIIIWDGGNNDTPFYKPDIHFVVADPHRAGHEIKYYPGEVNLRMADVILINKTDTAKKTDIDIVYQNCKKYNPKAKIIKIKMPITINNPSLIKNKKVLVIEDGPTLTHGGMSYGAGFIAAKKYKAKPINPRKYSIGSIKQAYKKYPHMKNILPALGYGLKQIKELEKTINKTKCDAVVIATPIDLSRLIKINKPFARVKYEIEADFGEYLKKFV
ncbi:GTPase [Candidatus Woesearchaeota archaeon]|nr:GTPase [Candidatus Woesearchaeota archaeon]